MLTGDRRVPFDMVGHIYLGHNTKLSRFSFVNDNNEKINHKIKNELLFIDVFYHFTWLSSHRFI